jgi:hypothetical protein
MLRVTLALVCLAFAATASAEQPPLVEKYLHTGDLTGGELALETALAKNPQDDQLRFGLGFLRIVKAVERLGQNLYIAGAKPNQDWLVNLRLPIPPNPDPAPITYRLARRGVEDFLRDLAAAETTLAGITDDRVRLPLGLAEARLDLTGLGKADVKFADVVRQMLGRVPDAFKENPRLKICFDRGDVAWFRAYCHLVSGVAELLLAVDSEVEFRLNASQLFPKIVPPVTDKEKEQLRKRNSWQIQLLEPLRWSRARQHFVQVCRLNRETWRYIRAETDDDFEWLPNTKQKGVLGLPVREEMITTWLRMIDELEALLEGRTVIPLGGHDPSDEKVDGLSVKKLLDDPDSVIDFSDIGQQNPRVSKYFDKSRPVDFRVLMGAFNMFSQPLMMGYAAWFN